MKVAKITLWNGETFYTNDPSEERISTFLHNARTKYAAPADARGAVELIDMTQEEYMALPVTTESAALFA